MRKAFHRTGYYNGDFNYSGSWADDEDSDPIDAACTGQSGVL